jgi:ankyrin repeat protein
MLTPMHVCQAVSNLPALVYAAAQGRAEIADILLKAGARIDDVNEKGESACHVAARLRHADVLRCFSRTNPISLSRT